jgi:FtsZ-interacting cell division protein ZipA
MSQLRWTLLILGVLFVAGLAWWEMRRQRQSPRKDSERLSPTLDSGADMVRGTGREPTLSLPELRAREPAHDPPVLEVADDSLIGLRIDGEPIEQELARADPPASEGIVPTVAPPPVVRPSAKVLPPVVFEFPEPIVEWPADEARRVVALRLVTSASERFPGRALRQALAAEGFVLGRFDIFHKPGPDARAVVSAASLSKPGTFTLDTMDGQRFGGLSLFAVLPGPLPAQQTFDELLSTARSLNDRLQGALQDERGEPLTPTRSAVIRDSLANGSALHAAP